MGSEGIAAIIIVWWVRVRFGVMVSMLLVSDITDSLHLRIVWLLMCCAQNTPGDVVKPELRIVHTSDGQLSRLRRIVSRRVPFSHRCCLTSISATSRKQHLGSRPTVMLKSWPSYCDAHLGRKWKRAYTKT